MNQWWSLALLVALVVTPLSASAAKKAAAKSKEGLTTDMKFDGSKVHGRYQFGGGTRATVEDEKMLRDLLSVRTDFKDRLKKHTTRR